MVQGSPRSRPTPAFGLSAPIFALFGAIATGCGDDGGSTSTGSGGGACAAELGADGCFDATCFTPPSEPVSFRGAVLPILETSCSLSGSCHGNPSSPETAAGYQPYLGEVNPESTPSDVALILATIVGQPSRAATSLSIVAPGDPAGSFLLHKMDGSLECTAFACDVGCGDLMPLGSDEPLDRATRDTIRAWIAQGAEDN